MLVELNSGQERSAAAAANTKAISSAARVRRRPQVIHCPTPPLPSTTKSPSPITSSSSRPPLQHPFHSQTATLIHSISAAAAWLLTSAGPMEVG